MAWQWSSVLSCKKRDKIKRFKNGHRLPSRRKREGMESSHRPGQQWTQCQRHKKLRKAEGSTEALGTSQPSKTVNLNTTPTAMDLGDVVQTPARSSNDPVRCTVKNVAKRDHRDEKPGGHQRSRRNGRNQSCCYPVFTCPYISCPCIHDTILSCDWVVGCLCLCSLFSLSYSVTSFLCAKERPCFKIGT